ncbi:hypothetical protein DPEC_G00174190, partial [Dallia pectoralis]
MIRLLKEGGCCDRNVEGLCLFKHVHNHEMPGCWHCLGSRLISNSISEECRSPVCT